MDVNGDPVSPPIFQSAGDSYRFLCTHYQRAILLSAPNVFLTFIFFNILEPIMPLELRVRVALFVYPFISFIFFMFTAILWMSFFINPEQRAYSSLKCLSAGETLLLGLAWFGAIGVFQTISSIFIYAVFLVVLFFKHLVFYSLYRSATKMASQNFDFNFLFETEAIDMMEPLTLLQAALFICLLLYFLFYIFLSFALFTAGIANGKKISFWKAEYLTLGLKHRFALSALLTCAPLVVLYSLSYFVPLLSRWHEWPEADKKSFSAYIFTIVVTILIPLVYSLQLFLWSSCAAAYYQWAMLHRNVDFEAP